MHSLQLRLNVAGALALEDTLISWGDSCLQDLQWWSDVTHPDVGIPLDLPHLDLLLFTDALDVGWGASLGDDHLSGSWSPISLTFSINHRSFWQFFWLCVGFSIFSSINLWPCFQTTPPLSNLRKEGGTLSSSLNSVAQAILRLCESRGVRLLP